MTNKIDPAEVELESSAPPGQLISPLGELLLWWQHINERASKW